MAMKAAGLVCLVFLLGCALTTASSSRTRSVPRKAPSSSTLSATDREIKSETEAREEEVRQAAMLRAMPAIPREGEPLYITWLNNVIAEVTGTAKGKDKAKGKSFSELSENHKRTFMPGEASFPNYGSKNGLTDVATCHMYPSESGDAYASPAQRAPEQAVVNGRMVSCDIESMRKLDLSPTANVVKPIVDGNNNLWVLNEARHSKDTISNLFCPSVPKIPGKMASLVRLNTISQLRQGEGIGEPDPTFVPTYGGEAETKYTTIKLKTRSASKKATKAQVYGKHFISIKKGEVEVLRAEGEGANGATNVWLEWVTGPMPLTTESIDEIDRLYTCVEKVQGLTPLVEACSTIRSCAGRGYTVEPYAGDADIAQGDILVEKLDAVKGTSSICQGNYLMPLVNYGTSHVNFAESKNIAIFLKAQTWAGRLASRLLTVFGAPPGPELTATQRAARRRHDEAILTGMFTIYIFNSYYFHTIDTQADTAKDNWSQLPKTAPLDLVRYLPPHLQGVLLAWVKTTSLQAIASAEEASVTPVATQDPTVPVAPALGQTAL